MLKMIFYYLDLYMLIRKLFYAKKQNNGTEQINSSEKLKEEKKY